MCHEEHLLHLVIALQAIKWRTLTFAVATKCSVANWQKIRQKFVKLIDYTYACNSLTNFEYIILKVHAMTGNGNHMNRLKIAGFLGKKFVKSLRVNLFRAVLRTFETHVHPSGNQRNDKGVDFISGQQVRVNRCGRQRQEPSKNQNLHWKLGQ